MQHDCLRQQRTACGDTHLRQVGLPAGRGTSVGTAAHGVHAGGNCWASWTGPRCWRPRGCCPRAPTRRSLPLRRRHPPALPPPRDPSRPIGCGRLHVHRHLAATHALASAPCALRRMLLSRHAVTSAHIARAHQVQHAAKPSNQCERAMLALRCKGKPCAEELTGGR